MSPHKLLFCVVGSLRFQVFRKNISRNVKPSYVQRCGVRVTKLNIKRRYHTLYVQGDLSELYQLVKFSSVLSNIVADNCDLKVIY